MLLQNVNERFSSIPKNENEISRTFGTAKIQRNINSAKKFDDIFEKNCKMLNMRGLKFKGKLSPATELSAVISIKHLQLTTKLYADKGYAVTLC